jgi:hypothetical protein
VTTSRSRKDLIVLVADKSMETAVMGVLSRRESLRIRKTEVDPFTHPAKDSGCLVDGPDFLRSFQNQYAYALLLFDREGCGREASSREDLEAQVEVRLNQAGWAGRSAAIVLDPELEIWVWSRSPHVATVLGWKDRDTELRSWLRAQGYLVEGQVKPARPKEAVEDALRIVKKPISSSIYSELTRRVSLEHCVDPAFVKLKGILQRWFGIVTS